MPRKLPVLPTVIKSTFLAGIKNAYEHLGFTMLLSAIWFILHVPLIMVLWNTSNNLNSIMPESGWFVVDAEHEGDRGLYLVKQDGSDLVRLPVDEPGIADPALSADGTKVAFVAGDDLRVLTIESGEVRTVAESGQYAGPVFSPDGGSLAYAQASEQGSDDLYLLDLASGEVERLTENEVQDRDPSFSPDGKTLVFASPDEDGNFELQSLDLQSKQVRQLTSTDASTPNTNPVFSPDGSRIAFLSRENGKTEIFITSADGRSRFRLTDNEVEEAELFFSSSGSKILFAPKDDRSIAALHLVGSTGGVERPLLQSGEQPGFFMYLMVGAVGALLFGALLAAPANAAMVYACRKVLEEDELRLRDFFIGFRRHYFISAAVYASFVLAVVFLIGNMAAAAGMKLWVGSLSMLLSGYLLLLLLLLSTHFPQLIVLQPNGFRKVWRKAFLLTVDNGLITLVYAIILGGLGLLSGVTMLPLVIFYPAAIGYAGYHWFQALMAKYDEEPAGG